MPIHGAVVILYNEDEMILVRHGEKSDHPTGSYSLPSGRIEVTDKDTRETAVRETKEETGLVIDANDLEFLKHLELEVGRKEGTASVSIDLYSCKADSKAPLVATDETDPFWVKMDFYLRDEYPLTYTDGEFMETVKGYLIGKMAERRGRF